MGLSTARASSPEVGEACCTTDFPPSRAPGVELPEREMNRHSFRISYTANNAARAPELTHTPEQTRPFEAQPARDSRDSRVEETAEGL